MNILPKISFFLGPILWQKPGENHHILIQSGDYLSGIPRDTQNHWDMISGEHSFVPANIYPSKQATPNSHGLSSFHQQIQLIAQNWRIPVSPICRQPHIVHCCFFFFSSSYPYHSHRIMYIYIHIHIHIVYAFCNLSDYQIYQYI